MDGDEGLCLLLDQDLEEDMLLVQHSATSLTRLMSGPCGLTPVRKAQRDDGAWGSRSMKPLLSRLSLGGDGPSQSNQQDSDR